MDRLYPLGTVIGLKNSDSTVMIIGYYPVSKALKKIYCYMAVSYPLGVRPGNNMVLINEESIGKVLYEPEVEENVKQYWDQYFNLMEKKHLRDEAETKIFAEDKLFY